MKANPPTLADALIASAYDKSIYGVGPPGNDGARGVSIRERCLSVAYMRKIVLDDDMSVYLADLGLNVLRGGLRKRLQMVENLRRTARLPHAMTWIEFNYRRYHEHLDKHGHASVRSLHGREPERFGFLLEQHPKIDTAFRMTECRSMTIREGRGWVHPLSVQWVSDESELPWPQLNVFEDSDAALVLRMEHYHSPRVFFAPSFDMEVTIDMLNVIMKRDGSTIDHHDGRFEDASGLGCLPQMPVLDVWALLATINDLPVRIEHVEPSRGYVARGSYKKFLKHSVIHLDVPQTRWRKLIAKTAAIVRRRAHQVRGHWRNDWRHPISARCEHVFNAEMICEKCRGRKLWIAEHARGDASIGFVTHDYEVHHESR